MSRTYWRRQGHKQYGIRRATVGVGDRAPFLPALLSRAAGLAALAALNSPEPPLEMVHQVRQILLQELETRVGRLFHVE